MTAEASLTIYDAKNHAEALERAHKALTEYFGDDNFRIVVFRAERQETYLMTVDGQTVPKRVSWDVTVRAERS